MGGKTTLSVFPGTTRALPKPAAVTGTLMRGLERLHQPSARLLMNRLSGSKPPRQTQTRGFPQRERWARVSERSTQQ